jgi:hypothetical protein
VAFRPNRKFKREYDKIFKRAPLAANMFLLLCEIANDKGQVIIKDEQELAELMAVRFEDSEAYQL